MASPSSPSALTPNSASRVVGIGIASPFELWNWEHQVGAPKEILCAWHDHRHAGRRWKRRVPWPVYFYNDATAACAAELLLGNPSQHPRFSLYLHRVVHRRRRRAQWLAVSRAGAAMRGPSPPCRSRRRPGRAMSRCCGAPRFMFWPNRCAPRGWIRTCYGARMATGRSIGPILDDWLEDLCESVAVVVLSATAIIDFEAMVIDGGFPPDMRARSWRG